MSTAAHEFWPDTEVISSGLYTCSKADTSESSSVDDGSCVAAVFISALHMLTRAVARAASCAAVNEQSAPANPPVQTHLGEQYTDDSWQARNALPDGS